MMTERHYDDEALVTMLAAGADASDAHLGTCTECTEKVVTFRCVTDALRDGATWDKRLLNDSPNLNTIATLRAFADTMAGEDTAAERFLAELLAGPRESWMPTLDAHPEYRTPGTVRRLIAATDRALDTMPADAVELTALAVDIADHLDPATHRPQTVATLRGQAWRERAYALFYTGQFAEAEKAVATAERQFAACVVDGYELARVGIVRAVVERGLEHHRGSIEAATQSAHAFREFGDRSRSISAEVAHIQVLIGSGEFKSARSRLLKLEHVVRMTDDVAMHTMLLGNLGYCARGLGLNEEAMRYYEEAAILYEELGNRSESTRVRWNVASLLAAEGRIPQALSRFEAVRNEMNALGMTGAAAVIALEIAELHLTLGDFNAVEELCKVAIASFSTSGLAHTAKALTALGLMSEAVRSRTATPHLVRKVRDYVRRLPEEPQLLFAPLPEP